MWGSLSVTRIVFSCKAGHRVVDPVDSLSFSAVHFAVLAVGCYFKKTKIGAVQVESS